MYISINGYDPLQAKIHNQVRTRKEAMVHELVAIN